jgi:hypothetical protein
MYPTQTIEPFNWSTLEPLFTALLKEDLTAQLVPAWLNRWSDLEKVLREVVKKVTKFLIASFEGKAGTHSIESQLETATRSNLIPLPLVTFPALVPSRRQDQSRQGVRGNGHAG